MSKKVGVIIISLVMIAACVSIWPLKFIRKDVVYWTQSSQYQYMENALSPDSDAVLEQTFIAQEAYLKQIAFAVAFSGSECDIRFSLYNQENEQLFERQIVLGAEYNSGFFYVDINKWVKKGEQYTFGVEVLNAENVNPQFMYTLEGEPTAKGNLLMMVNGESFDAQAVTSYTYEEPLNYKNAVCIWAAILTLGLSVIGMLYRKEWKSEIWADKILDKYQYVLLALEILFVTALVVRVSFTETVDWDEAYTWKIVTRNSLWGIIQAQAIDPHPPLYFLMAKLATLVFGNKMMVFKAVSVAGALASMLMCATLVRKRWGVKVAIPLILLLGLGPQFLFYNINLRMYSWMVFFVFASALFIYELVLEDKISWWIALCLTTLGALYTQYFAVVPLAVLYAYLLVICVRSKRVKRFLLCCVVTVIAYLPQLYLVWQMVQRDRISQNEEMPASLSLVDLCGWAFQTNIKWSEYMPLVLFVAAVGLLIFQRKQLERKETGFLVLAAMVFPLTDVICYIISNNMNHFWHNRYMLDALLFVWIFVIIIYAKQNTKVWVCFCVWLGITVLSSYIVVQSEEFSMMANTVDAKEKLAHVQDEEMIVFNFTSYDVIYEYYVPNAEFVWIEDVDFSNMEKDYFYMISWGGLGFSQEVIDKYNVHIEYLQPFILERGVAGVYLCKVTFHK